MILLPISLPLLHTRFSFLPEDGGIKFIRNIGKHVQAEVSACCWFCLLSDPEEGNYTFLRKSVKFYQTTWRHIIEDSALHSHHCQNLKFVSLCRFEISGVSSNSTQTFPKENAVNMEFERGSSKLLFSHSWRPVRPASNQPEDAGMQQEGETNETK
jgi:hypothetical protein